MVARDRARRDRRLGDTLLPYNRTVRTRLLPVAAVLIAAGACDTKPHRDESPKPSEQQSAPGPTFVKAPGTGEVAPIVASELKRAAGDPTLVYVSATWCEPCRYFERALDSGELVTAFPRLRLIKFDFDRDEARLADAGYVSDLIPLFAVPDPSGRASGRQMAGSIKGPTAVQDNMVPRLRELLSSR